MIKTVANKANNTKHIMKNIMNTSTAQIIRVCSKEVKEETYRALLYKVREAGLAELYALEKKITRHYNNGTINERHLSKLDSMIMEEIARFDCLDDGRGGAFRND